MDSVISYKLESFEGPLDLLLQLIARNKLNIYDIKLTVLIDQYLEQIKLFEEQEMDISSEFLEMASRLIYMKTVSLLPKHDEIEKLRDELIGELLEYQVCRKIAEDFSKRMDGFNSFVRRPEEHEFEQTYDTVHSSDIIYLSYLAAVGRGQRRLPPSVTPFTKIVAKKIVSVSAKIVFVMRKLIGGTRKLSSLYSSASGRSELVATFLAVLELCKANRVEINGDGTDNSEIKLVRGHKKR